MESPKRKRKINIESVAIPIMFLVLAISMIVIARAGCDAWVSGIPAVSDTVTDKIEQIKEINIDNGTN